MGAAQHGDGMTEAELQARVLFHKLANEIGHGGFLGYGKLQPRDPGDLGEAGTQADIDLHKLDSLLITGK